MAFLAFFFPYPHPAFVEDAPFMLKLLEDVDGLCLRIALHQQYSRSRHLDLEYCCHDGTPMDLTFSWKVILRVSGGLLVFLPVCFTFGPDQKWNKLVKLPVNHERLHEEIRQAVEVAEVSVFAAKVVVPKDLVQCIEWQGHVHHHQVAVQPVKWSLGRDTTIAGARRDWRDWRVWSTPTRKKWQEKIMEAQTLWLGDPVWLNGSEGWQA